MFTWYHEQVQEVNLPLKKIWSFAMNPHNWPKWIDTIDSCSFSSPLKAGSIVKAKIRNRSGYLSFMITEIEHEVESKILLRTVLGSQESSMNFQEVSRGRTSILHQTSISSILCPFFKSTFLKSGQNQHQKFLNAVLENVKGV